MATYTGVADANGDFRVPFSTNYTSGQKITVTAEKDAATKTIELFAPSETTGNGVIQFTGTLDDFPKNIGGVLITGLVGKIFDYAFALDVSITTDFIFNKATSLKIDNGISEIGSYAFWYWKSIVELNLPSTLISIGNYAFYGWSALQNLTIPNSVVSIGAYAFSGLENCISLNIGSGTKTIGVETFYNMRSLLSADLSQSLMSIEDWACASWSECNTVTVRASAPPIIKSNTFAGVKSTVRFYVPASSLAAYKAAPIWKTFASKIYAIA